MPNHRLSVLTCVALAGCTWGAGPAAAQSAPTLPTPTDPAPKLVTTTGPAALQTSPGQPVSFPPFVSSPLDIDGVAQLTISIPGEGTFLCTASLLDGGTTVLTAAHCLDAGETGELAPGTAVLVTWTTPQGTISQTSGAVTLHPEFTGNLTGGNDVAVIELASPIDSGVPRYDIYRGASVPDVGAPRIKVGFGQSGQGDTGATVNAGVKRAGLNSYDADARALLAAFGNGANPFGGPLPDLGDTLAYDFDNGSPLNDAFGLFGVNDTGFGDFEVNAAPGDSGGPTFIEANDTQLSLEDGGDLGVFLIDQAPAQEITIERTGRNGTAFDLFVAGDAVTADLLVQPFDEASDLPDFKILGITSYGFGLDGLPDVSAGTDSSFGEFTVDSSAAAEQAFVDGIAGPVAPAETAFRTALFEWDDATPGFKSVSLTLDNLAVTSELPGLGADDPDDTAVFTATVTFPGDATLDFQVDLADFSALSDGFDGDGGFTTGDFNQDGVVDLLDFALLADNFGAGATTPATAAVPEPATGAGLALTAAILARRRRPAAIGARRRSVYAVGFG